MNPLCKNGFSLLELLVATGLGLLVAAAMGSLLAPVLRAQAAAQSSQTVQLGAAAAMGVVERMLRQATMISQPRIVGAPSGTLEGCLNAELLPGAAVSTAVNPLAPVVGFAVCSVHQALWLYQGSGCPLVYKCGTRGGLVIAGIPGGPVQASASFTIDSMLAPAITANLSVISGTDKAQVLTAVALTRASEHGR